MSSRIKLTIEYDGTNYFGWQYQNDKTPTVQHELEKAVFKLFEEKLSVTGAGRTDAGVHARNQIAHFTTTRDPKNYNLVHAFQAMLDHDIVVKKAELVPEEFHSIRSSVSKTYIYKIWNHEIPTALHRNKALWIRKPLNLERLNKALEQIIGTHDFNCFRSEGSPVNSTFRTIHSAKFAKSGEFIEFTINGDGFLKQMVRNIVGTLLQIELNDRPVESISDLIKSRNRQQAGPTVAAQGLYLAEVFYPPELDKCSQPL